jgi:uncharacterized membrane protein
MESRVRLLGHPVHQMLVVFPLGMLGAAAAFDVLYRVQLNPQWALISYWLIAAGVIMGLVAAPFGYLDWRKIPSGTRAYRVGLFHLFTNVGALVVFALSFLIRRPDPSTPTLLASVLAWIAILGSFVAAWFGGELVDRLGVGVSSSAHLDAPSSLTTPTIPKQSASQTR